MVKHVEVVPISNRLNVVFLSKAEEEELGTEGERAVCHQQSKHILPASRAIVKEVKDITCRLRDVCIAEGLISPEKKFNVYVIESPVVNAFVLPNGAIFVYTGIIPFAESEAGLAAILGHEISHALARHAAEKMGYVEVLMVWTEFCLGVSDIHQRRSIFSSLLQFVAITVLQKVFSLSHSRQCESEADMIGLELSAKAGYDPRHAAQVWERMVISEGKEAGGKKEEDNTDLDKEGNPVLTSAAVATTPPSSSSSLAVKKYITELMSTHPCHERRITALKMQSEELMETYQKSSEELFMQKNVWDTSTRLLEHKSRDPRILDILDGTSTSADEAQHTERSMELAKASASLMVGEKGDQWARFMKSLDLQV